MKSKRIVIVDRDPKLCQALSEQFDLQKDYLCRVFNDAASALAGMDVDGADILLIDSGLPDMSPPSFNEALRAKDACVPVIFMLRPEDEDDDDALSDLAGVHDVLARPFRFADLLALVKGHLRARETHDGNDIQIGPYRFRHATKILIDAGANGEERRIRLTEKEADILKFLCDENGQVVPREVLLAEVWGYNSGVTTHTLETHIYRLRQKIERDPSNAEYLVTEAGGYRLAR